MSNTLNPRAITLHDVKLGAAIRQARIVEGMSQEELGKAIGTTFQQVQKYENAANRVPATRLRLIADALRTKMHILMAIPENNGTDDSPYFELTAREMDLIKAWRKLNSEQRQSIRRIVSTIADGTRP